MIERKHIERAFPELEWIEDENLREKIVDVWKKAAEYGKWKKLEEIPFTLSFDKSGLLIDHTKRVAKLVKNVVKNRRESVNLDRALAGALLHDVGKLLEYEMRGDRVTVSKMGEKVRHPISGAKLARECGLPEEVIHIIASHSKEGDKMDRSIEAIIVHHCDFIDFEIKKKVEK